MIIASGPQMQSSPASNTKTPRPVKKTTTASTSTTPGCATYAFITHSPDTLPHNLPPDVDNNALARRRRRRTSQHDQAILEAEYAKNERPDKAARKEITRKVCLGEKEVQIWFQNRRQTNRRKAKPLLPHEMIPKTASHDSAILSSDPIISSEADGKAHDIDTSMDASDHVIKTEFEDDHEMPTSPCASDMDSPMSEDSPTIDKSGSFTESTRSSDGITRKASPLHMLLNPAPEPSKPNPSTLPTTESITSQADSTADVNSSTNDQPVRRVPALLKRSSSTARLAMSLEGKASIILEDEPTSPSPSSQPSSTCSSFTEATSAQPKRRTVNAKVWEVCCDSRQSSAPPSGNENTTQDTPRKTIKLIRARKLVADAKAAAERRRKRASRKTAGGASKGSDPKEALAPKSANKLAAKLQKVAKSSPKVIDKHQKIPKKEQHSTPKKAQKPRSAVGATPGPLYLKTPESLPRNPQNNNTHDGAESDKENLDPDGNPRVNTENLAATKAAGNAILKDLPLDVGAGEIECIENLLSLRGGIWG